MQNQAFNIFVFFLGTSMTIASLHIGLVRLIVSKDSQQASVESGGILIVIQLTLLIIFCAAIPIATESITSESTMPYGAASIITPITLICMSSLNIINHNWGKLDSYHQITAAGLIVCNFILLICNYFFASALNSYLLSLSSALCIISAQLYKSTSRFESNNRE